MRTKSGLLGTVSLSFVLFLGMTACGSDKKDDSPDDGRVDCGEACARVLKASGNKVTVTFEGAEAGSEYIVMPYVLGRTSEILGAGPEKVTFNIATSNGSASEMRLLKRSGPKQQASDTVMDYQAYDLAWRTLYHRMDTSKGLAQSESFWKAVDKLDAVSEVSAGGRPANRSFFADRRPVLHSIRQEFTDVLSQAQRQNLKAQRLKSGLSVTTTSAVTCPTTGGKVIVPEPEVSGTPEDATVLDAVDGDGYCIAYLSVPKTESDKAAIKTSIETILERYKEVIYDDSLAPAGGFTFEPIFVIADFSDDNVWPPKAEDKLQVAGIVLTDINANQMRPIVYMASDFSKLGDLGADAAKAKKIWHGTLAHETQHAITDYFRRYVGTDANQDIVAIDEGVAHFMEDIFGYGEENFAGYAGNFLSTWNEGITPVLNSSDEVIFSSTDRGASQSLIYYLASQKGGVTFEDGVVSGGDGLDFIRSVAKSKKKGPANLIASFGSAPDWVEIIGNYMGALVLDGTTIKNVATVNQAQDPEPGVHDLTGETDKTFGMSYNNYLDVDDRTAAASQSAYTVPEDATVVEDLQYYQTKPLLYKVEDPDVSYVFTTDGDTPIVNTAVAIVRIK